MRYRYTGTAGLLSRPDGHLIEVEPDDVIVVDEAWNHPLLEPVDDEATTAAQAAAERDAAPADPDAVAQVEEPADERNPVHDLRASSTPEAGADPAAPGATEVDPSAATAEKPARTKTRAADVAKEA